MQTVWMQMGRHRQAVCGVLGFKGLYILWALSRCTSNFRILPPHISPSKAKTGIFSVLDFIPSYLPCACGCLFPKLAQRQALSFKIKQILFLLLCICVVYVYAVFLCVLVYMGAHLWIYIHVCMEALSWHQASSLITLQYIYWGIISGWIWRLV